jgi:hypothetical protein
MHYEFRVRGCLSPPMADAFPELEKVAVSGQTVLFGPVTDEAHLYGLLFRFQDLGLHVVEMRQLPD